MHTRCYSLATIGAALAVAGCGSSTKTTAAGGSSQPAPATPSNASAVSPAASGGGEGVPGLELRSSEYGKVIFASNNRVLYTFGADHGTTSTCYGVCASAWPPLLSKGSQPSVGTGLNPSLLGTTRRNDGSTQVTYAGHPLYYYSGDAPGKIMCQAANMHGGFWYIVNADGSPNKAKGHAMMMMGHEKMKAHEKM
jgi:predicted lipoprotein with Yx(FWY)xxD motif